MDSEFPAIRAPKVLRRAAVALPLVALLVVAVLCWHRSAVQQRPAADRPVPRHALPGRGLERALAAFDWRARPNAHHPPVAHAQLIRVGAGTTSLPTPVQATVRRAEWPMALGLSMAVLAGLAIGWRLGRGARRPGRGGSDQAMLAASFESAADELLLLDEDRQVLKSNRRFRERWGGSEALAAPGLDAAALNRMLAQLVDPRDLWRHEQASSGPEDRQLDLLCFKDGRVLERSSQTVESEGLRVRLWSFRDVAERQQHDDALRRSDELYRALFDTSPDALLLLDDGRFSACNRAAMALFGHDRAALLELGAGDVSPALQPDGEESFRKAASMVALAQTQGCHRFEWMHARRDGSEFLAEVALSSIRLPHRQVICMGVRDITHRQRAELALRRSEERARSIFEGARDGILLADAATQRFVDANPTVCAMLGYPKADILALSVADIHPPADLAHVNEVFGRQVRGEVVVAEDLPVLRRDGSVFQADISVAPVQLDGRLHVAGFFRDITERKRVEAELALHQTRLRELVEERTRQLALAKDAAEAANVAKSIFLANMSHEIRTPMNAILGMTHLLKRSGLNPTQQDQVVKVDSAGRHLLALISDILDLSKIEAGAVEIRCEDFELDELLEYVQSMTADVAQRKGLRVSAVRRGLPDRLHGDPTRLRQALLNLVGNAVKFTDSGHVAVQAEALEASAAELTVRFSVEDTGVGIPSSAMERIFDAFEQVHDSSRPQGGTGLGLAITRQLAQLMGGHAGVESRPGIGSLFWFTVRVGRAAHAPVVGGAALPEGDAESRLRAKHVGARVMVAEDNDVNREVIGAMLEPLGFVVDCAEDGHAALRLGGMNHYDLVLMDLQMPRLDGLGATRALRRMDGWADTPIVALTADAMSESRADCLAAGMDDYLTKPIDSSLLYSCLLRWLDRKAPELAALD